MGNSNTKESRPGDSPEGFSDGRGRRTDFGDPMGVGRTFISDPSALGRHQISRGDRSFLGLGGGSSSARTRDRPDAPFEHRETKQEREARRLERERAARAKERERSIREEHVDGGYLVTMGTYTGTEDFSKPVVRQLQIERKLAPFWRGLNDWSESWAEHQLIAAARGLPVPAADAPPDPDLILQPPPPPDSLAGQNLNGMTVEMGPRTLSTASDRSGSGTGSPATAGPSKSAIKPRARALAAALSVGSRNASSTDLAPKEMNLPHDPFVNGQPIEVFLYKDATECPICFLTYPPYLNHTRCCDQPICSECFVQIKRADPHLPEHHPDGQAQDPNQAPPAETPADAPPERLISEPSTCPYCQQIEFGVTYDPPPFRRGLVYSTAPANLPYSTAMSSQSSLNSTLSPSSPNPTGRRRTHSLSAKDPNVITTDRVRPDWLTKLTNARSQQARRNAAATALHAAAFLMGSNESRSRIRSGRFRRNTAGSNSGGASTPGGGQSGGVTDVIEGPEPGERGSSRNTDGRRRTRAEELEDMMFMEAVRLSLASEEERKRKEEKTLRKEAKKREQEERKALKKQSKDPYGGGLSGASGSSLSLGLGRKRGNSVASNLRMETTAQATSQPSKAGEASSTPERESKPEDVSGKGKGVDRGPQDSTMETSSPASLPIPSRGGSHLRQMSNASSLGSSVADSQSGSYTGQGFSVADGVKRLSLGPRTEEGDRDPESEPMFNFRSLAELVGVNIDDGSATRQGGVESTDEFKDSLARPLSQVKEDDKEETEAEHVEDSSNTVVGAGNQRPSSHSAGEQENAEQGSGLHLTSPEVMLTPQAPVSVDGAAENKQLGQSSVTEHQPTQVQQ